MILCGFEAGLCAFLVIGEGRQGLDVEACPDLDGTDPRGREENGKRERDIFYKG